VLGGLPHRRRAPRNANGGLRVLSIDANGSPVRLIELAVRTA